MNNDYRKKHSLDDIERMVSLRNSGMSYREVAKFFGCSSTTINTELKKAKKNGFSILEPNQGYQYFPTQENHLACIKKNVESFTEFEKYLCKKILNLKKNGSSNKEIIKILKIPLSNLDRLISKMRLTGMMKETINLNYLDNEIKIINQFEMISKKNLSMRQITQLLSTSRAKLYRIIYKHLIKNENI